MQFITVLTISGYPKYISVQQFSCAKKTPTFSGGRGWGLSFAVVSVGLVLNFDSQIRRLNVDGLSGLTNYAPNRIQHLACGLQLPLLDGLIKQFGTHVLKPRQHIFAIRLPVFINEKLYFCPIAPSGIDADLFPLNMLINCLLYTSPSPRDGLLSRMPSSA